MAAFVPDKPRALAAIILILLFIFLLYWTTSSFFIHLAIQSRFDSRLQKSLSHFAFLKQNDVLDLTQIAPIPWDTVYVFQGNTSESTLARDLGHVSWDRVMNRDEQVPDDVTRFIFTNNLKAISYLDVSNQQIQSVGLLKYYVNEQGDSHTYYTDSTGAFHNNTLNHFDRKHAIFYLDIAVAESNYEWQPFAYFMCKRKYLTIPLTTTSASLQPLSKYTFQGCNHRPNSSSSLR